MYKKDTCVVRYQERCTCVVSNFIPVLICLMKLSVAYYTEKDSEKSRFFIGQINNGNENQIDADPVNW